MNPKLVAVWFISPPRSVRDSKIDGVQPYWPADSIENPDNPAWETLLTEASILSDMERNILESLVVSVGAVDLLQAASGEWWLTDCAEGERSFRYDPANPPKRERNEYIGDESKEDVPEATVAYTCDESKTSRQEQ